jgi:hypothetical protein
MLHERDLPDDDVIDLGAATEKTLGLPDDILKENFVVPEARDE